MLRSAAAKAVETCNGLEALTLTAPKGDGRLPSWIPDVSTGSIGLFLVSGSQHYRAAGSTTPSVRWSPGYLTMHMRGVVIDTVSEFASDKKYRLGRSRRLASKRGKQHHYSKEEVIQCFWRTMIANQGRYPGVSTDRVKYPAPTDLGLRFRASQKEMKVPESEIREGIREDWEMEYYKPWYTSVSTFTEREQSRFFVTKLGRFGLGQRGLREGDLACILLGSRTISLLRRDGTHYRFVGAAYIHGLMDGEKAPLLHDESKVEEFEVH